MGAIDQVRQMLSSYPQVKYERTASSISVPPLSSEGFRVTLEVSHNHFMVSFNGWHENFQRQDEALNCFVFGLSDECRLQEIRRGNFAYRWIVEFNENGSWVADSETGLFFFPFWKTKEVRYLQNSLMSSDSTRVTPRR